MFERTKNLRLSVIKQIELKAAEYPDVISLAQGIPSFDTPAGIKRRVENALKRGVVAKYSLSPGLPELRELIEISLAQENMFYDWEKEIIVTAGSIEAITATIFAITEPGDEIIIPEPTYTSYREVITLAGCRPISVPLDEARGWAFDLKKFEDAVTSKTKAIFYCNPNNPTGTIYSKEDLLGLARLAEKRDLFLISDEVYKDFIFDDFDYFSLAEDSRYRKRLIRIFGFSKSYAMTGWRVGYLHTDEEVAREILKVHDCLVTCAPTISQYAAMGALEMGESDLKKFVLEFRRLRDLTCDYLDKMKHYFSYARPNSAYYVFPRICPSRADFGGQASSGVKVSRLTGGAVESKSVNSWDFAMELLDKAQVAVVPGSAFGENGEGHIRINFGRGEESVKKAFQRIEKFIS